MIGKIVEFAFRKFADDLRQSDSNVGSVQEQTFHKLKNSLNNSELAQQSGFSKCASLAELKNVPRSDEVLLQSHFKNAFENGIAASSIFGKSPIRYFGRTSGSTGQPKYIPINQAHLDSYDRSVRRMATGLLGPEMEWGRYFQGKKICLGSRPLVGSSPTGVPICDISGLLHTRGPWILRPQYIPTFKDMWVENWQEKIQLVIKQAKGKNVTAILGLPALALAFAELARKEYGVQYLTDVWPSLDAFIYGGVHLSKPQRAHLQDQFCRPGQSLRFCETYFATEGALGFSGLAPDEGMRLNLNENVYLFSNVANPNQVLQAHEVEVGGVYSVLLTTPGGLINYQIGDQLKILSTTPLRVLVSGRDKEELSMTGEKITVAQLDLALNDAGFPLSRFGEFPPIVGISEAAPHHLVWHFPDSIGVGQISADQLDRALCRYNVLYEEALNFEKVIGKSEIRLVTVETFNRFKFQRLQSGQFKPKRLFRSQDECRKFYSE